MSAEAKHTGSFMAFDENGRMCMVWIVATVASLAAEGKQRGRAVGSSVFQTSAGETVCRIGAGAFQIARTGRILTTEDPHAP
jgi:hypothetical protein